MILKVATYNLWDYGQYDEPRYDLVHKVLRELADDGVHLIAVQELSRPDDLPTLAKEAGRLTSYYDPPWWDEEDYRPGRIAAAAANGQDPVKHHVGLMWDPSILHAQASTWRTYPEMWHNLALLDFDAGGTILRAGSYHGPPFGRARRCDEAERVVSAMTRPYSARPLSMVGADWNTIPADRVFQNGKWEYWHPDPYADQPWTEPFIYQCSVLSENPDGTPAHWQADRRPGQVLLHAGIRDTAALAAAPWVPTVGHADHADMGPRSIDTWRVSSNLAPAVISHQVVDTPLTRAASDHLPVVAVLDLSRLP